MVLLSRSCSSKLLANDLCNMHNDEQANKLLSRRYIPTKEMKDFSSQAPYWWEQAHAALLQEKELADKDMREALPGRLRRAAKFRLLRINRKVRKNEQLLRTNSWRNFCNSFEDASQLYALFKRSKGSHSIPPFRDTNGNLCTTDREMAEGFNLSYATVGNRPVPTSPFHSVVYRDSLRYAPLHLVKLRQNKLVGA